MTIDELIARVAETLQMAEDYQRDPLWACDIYDQGEIPPGRRHAHAEQQVDVLRADAEYMIRDYVQKRRAAA